MTTDLDLDHCLIEAARLAGNHLTKEAAITAALKEYIRRKQLEILDLFGTIDYDPAYDSKQAHQLDRIEQEAE